jgi:hypothetical protein
VKMGDVPIHLVVICVPVMKDSNWTIKLSNVPMSMSVWMTHLFVVLVNVSTLMAGLNVSVLQDTACPQMVRNVSTCEKKLVTCHFLKAIVVNQ